MYSNIVTDRYREVISMLQLANGRVTRYRFTCAAGGGWVPADVCTDHDPVIVAVFRVSVCRAPSAARR